MDPATIIGLVMALVAIVAMITLEGGNIGAIFLPAPLILVFGGSIGAAMAGGLLSDAKAAAVALKRALLSKPASPDGTVEAVEEPERRFAVGVLWHPEAGEDLALFRALVEEARAYREARQAVRAS